MRGLSLELGDAPRILFVGAHSDDIEIGCGGTALSLVRAHPNASFSWVVFAAAGEREHEARASAAEILGGVRDAEVRCFAFPDSYFPSHVAEIKREMEALKAFEPDLVFTHRGRDRHQDHRLVSELTWNAFRDHVLLEYEIPKYDGDLRSPNVFVPLSRELGLEKVDLLRRHFATQRARHWFDEELFLGLMRLRGVEGRSPSGFAEGFHARKLCLDL